MRCCALLVLVGCHAAPVREARQVAELPAGGQVGEPDRPDGGPLPDAAEVGRAPGLPDGGQAPALDAVAEAAARSASEDYVVSARAVRAAMAEQLGSGLWPYVLAARGGQREIEDRLATELAELRAELGPGGVAELGIGFADGQAGRAGVIVVLPPPVVAVDVARDRDTARIAFAWQWADAPAAYAVTPTASRRLAPVVEHAQLALAIDCRRPARREAMEIEIRAGARVVASVVGPCGEGLVDPAGAVDLGPPARTRVELEQRVFELINQERVANGRAALAWDPEALRFAREHAEDMADHAYVGHEAPDGAHLRERVERGGLRSASTRENVGHAWGPGEVHVAFMHSPGHRENLLAADVDRGAVGIASDRIDPRAFYITEVFRTP